MSRYYSSSKLAYVQNAVRGIPPTSNPPPALITSRDQEVFLIGQDVFPNTA